MTQPSERPHPGLPARPKLRQPPGSCHDALDDFASDIGETKITAAVPISQPLMVEAQQRQDRRVQIMDMHFVLHGRGPELVGGSINAPAPYAAAGQARCKALAVMVAPTIVTAVSVARR